MLEWLDYRDRHVKSSEERMLLELEIEEGIREKPEPPEPFVTLFKLRRFGLNLYDGGYLAQPYISLMEFHAVIDAETEHERRVAANLTLQREKQEVINGQSV